MITPTDEDLNQAGVVLRKYSPGVDSRWAIVKDVAQAIASAREAGEAKGRREAEERAEVTINKLARECNRLNGEKREAEERLSKCRQCGHGFTAEQVPPMCQACSVAEMRKAGIDVSEW